MMALLPGFPAHATVIVNEFLASNTHGLQDEDGDAPDWIELFNTGAQPVSLLGYGITDRPEEPFLWIMPDVTIPAGGYLIVFASNKNRTSPNLHTNFALSASGEFVGLYTPEGVPRTELAFGPQTTDVSYGRFPNGSATWQFFQNPTPGAANTSPSAPAPVITLPSGYYSGAQQVTILVNAPGASIYYTLDGGIPTTSSLLYSGSVSISQTRVLRARTVIPGYEPSPVVTATYLLDDPGTMPTLSLVTAPANLWNSSTGIYANPHQTGVEWERPVYLEFFENGNTEFSLDAGVRIHGGASRDHSKKSFRLYFRSAYGNSKLEYPLFPDKPIERYDRLVLRAGANDGTSVPESAFRDIWTHMRDACMNDLARHAGDPLVVAQRPAKVYLNGESWGIYWILERIDDDFMKDNIGWDEFDVIKNQVDVVEGDIAHWNATTTFFNNNNLSGTTAYNTAIGLMSPDSLARHYALMLWGGNLDWPHNNTYQVRRRNPDEPWLWVQWDSDLTFGSPNWVPWTHNMYGHVNGDHISGNNWSTIHFRRFKDNPTFRTLFVNQVADLLNTTLTPNHVRSIINANAAKLRPDIAFETNRWGSSPGAWEDNVWRLGAWTDQRADQFWGHTQSFFSLSGRYQLTVNSPQGQGAVRINTLKLNSFPWQGQYYNNVGLPVEAIPAPGYVFVGWEGGGLPNTREATLTRSSNTSIRALFEPLPPSAIAPNDVIINEYWVNDNGTTYDSIEGRPLRGDWVELLVTKTTGISLRGWRLTNNDTKTQINSIDPDQGSLIFPNIPQLDDLQRGTTVLVIATEHAEHDQHFPQDDLDDSDGRLIFYVGNNNLDRTTDPGFSIQTGDDNVVLLAPGTDPGFADDIGVDFIAEGIVVTPQSFGVDTDGVVFTNPFAGIGNDDGAIFTNDPQGGLNNDNGADPDRTDDQPGPGGWIVDPPAQFTGDAPDAVNILSPGAVNYMQLTGNEPPPTPTPVAGNLVLNPGFELDGVSFIHPPMHWSKWSVMEEADGTLKDSDWSGFVGVRSGTFCAGKFTNWGRPQVGYYQQLTVVPGMRYEAAVWVYTPRSNPSQAAGRVRLGLSPGGATSHTAGDIVWTSFQSFVDGYGELALRGAQAVQAAGSTMTIFIEMTQNQSAPSNAMFIDDVSVVLEGGGATATPTATFTNTPVPPATATPTAHCVSDIDGDLVCDAQEAANLEVTVGGTMSNRMLPDSDGDGLLDGEEDTNFNGQRDPGETWTRMADSDGDGFEDGLEIFFLQSDPLDAGSPGVAFVDNDGDGLPASLDPDDNNRDTDGDRYDDLYDALAFRDLAAAQDPERVPHLGDVNGDDEVGNLDALIVQALFLGAVDASSPIFQNSGLRPGYDGFRYSDPNRDAQVGNLDALILQAYFLGALPTIPLR